METFIKFYLKTLLSFARVLPFLHSDNPKDKNTEEDRNLVKNSLLYRCWACRHFAELYTAFQPFDSHTSSASHLK